MSLREVPQIHSSNYRDAVATLRELAAAIAAGEHGDVDCVGVVVFGDRGVEVFGMGPGSDSPSVALVLQAGAHKFVQALLDIDGDDDETG